MKKFRFKVIDVDGSPACLTVRAESEEVARSIFRASFRGEVCEVKLVDGADDVCEDGTEI